MEELLILITYAKVKIIDKKKVEKTFFSKNEKMKKSYIENINSWFCEDEYKACNKEINRIKKLEKYDHFPKIISIKKNSFIMSYCGVTLRRLIRKKGREYVRKKLKNIDLETQIKNISKYLDENLIQHYDLGLNNICFYNNKIYIIDFGGNYKSYFIKGENYKILKEIFDFIINNKPDLNYSKRGEHKQYTMKELEPYIKKV